MEDYSDDNLRKVFGKLEGYASRQEGIAWSHIEKVLNAGNPTRIISILSLLSILLLTVPATIDFPLAADRRAPQMAPSEPIGGLRSLSTLPDPSRQRTANTSHSHDVRCDSENFRPSFFYTVTTAQSVMTSRSVPPPDTREQAISTTVLKTDSAQADLALYVLKTLSDSIVSEETTASENEKRKVNWSIAALYQFGFVNPILTDNIVIREYQSKPGLGLRTEVLVPGKIRRKNIRFSVSYSFIYKPLEFSFSQYGTETISYADKKTQSLSHILGAGIVCPIGSDWTTAGHLNYAIGGMHPFTGRTSLTISLQKNFGLKKSRLYAGAMGGIPVTGRIQYFKYYPVQLFVGFQIGE